MNKKISAVLREQVFAKNSPLYLPQDKAAFFPDRKKILQIFKMLRDALLVYTLSSKKLTPQTIEKNISRVLDIAYETLKTEIKKTFCLFCKDPADCGSCDIRAEKITADFINDLPLIQQLVLTDIQAAYDGDPAAVDPYEIILCYPGFNALIYQRMAHYIYKKGVAVIPRIITEYAHSLSGADIHPGAQIGKRFFIDHGTGVVIGGTAVIGDNVKLYQGVTLGAKSFPLDKTGNPVKGIKRHPNVGNNVIIYANATVLGDINIEDGVIIGANQTIMTDVKKGTKIK